MSVGIVVSLPAYTLDPAFIARKAEDLGFEYIWYHEHPILPVKSDSPFPSNGGEIPWTYRHFSEPDISLACLEGDWSTAREYNESGLEVSALDPILLLPRVLLEHETGE